MEWTEGDRETEIENTQRQRENKRERLRETDLEKTEHPQPLVKFTQTHTTY